MSLKIGRGREPFVRAVKPVLALTLVIVLAACTARAAASAEPVDTLDGQDGRPLALDQFRPEPMLKVKHQAPERAKFPVVDVHTHFRIRAPKDVDAFVRLMDEQNIAMCVSLDGRIGDELAEHRKYLWSKYPDRFAIFANVDWQGTGSPNDPASWDCQRPDFARRVAEQLEAAKRSGASGLKVFKDFGLGYRNPDGSLIEIDDPRWDPIWEACGRLGLVVLIHTADPSAFFEPIDATNERWEELHRHPEWSFYGPQWPKRAELHAARNRVIARHPETKFIAAHMGNDGEDLEELAAWLDAYPNLFVDITSRISELGRQPYTARAFFVKYADRILFGTDGPRVRERLLPQWRFLESYDEYFPYAENPFPPQGFWRIYGIGLPDDVLRKVYHENAARIIPGVNEKLQRGTQQETEKEAKKEAENE